MTRNGRSLWFTLDYSFMTFTRLKIFVLFLVSVLPCTLGARSHHSHEIKKGSLASVHSRWLRQKHHGPLLTSFSTSALRKARFFQLLARNRAALVKALQSTPNKAGKKENYKALIDNHLQKYTTQVKEDEDAFVRSTRCSNKMDLAFVMGGCGSHSFDACAHFVKSVIKDLAINRHDTRIGVVLFSRRAKVLFGFQDFNSLAEISRALDHIKYRERRPRNTVRIGKALQVARYKLFTKSRKNVSRTLVLVTGGESQDDVIAPANHLRADGVEIYGVGLGRGFRFHQLKAVATQPVAKHVFTQSVRSRAGVLRSLRTIVCRRNEPSVSEEEPPFPATLVFLLDGSKHLSERNFRTVKHFLNSVVRSMNVASDALKIGIAECGDNTDNPPEMVMYESVEQIEEELDGITKISGKCKVGYSIQMIEQEAFDVTPNGTARILVAILAGKSDDDVATAAEELKRKSVRVMVLGVGQTVDKAQMEDIAENPVYALKVPLFDYLTAMTSTVTTFIEQAVSSSASTERRPVESLIFSLQQNDDREDELLDSEAENGKVESEGNATAVDSWESTLQQNELDDAQGSGVPEEEPPAQQGTGTSAGGSPAQQGIGTSEEGPPAQQGTGTSSSLSGPGTEGSNAAEMSQSGARILQNAMANTGGSSPNQAGANVQGQNPVATNTASGSNVAAPGSSLSPGSSVSPSSPGSSGSSLSPGSSGSSVSPGSSGLSSSSGLSGSPGSSVSPSSPGSSGSSLSPGSVGSPGSSSSSGSPGSSGSTLLPGSPGSSGSSGSSGSPGSPGSSVSPGSSGSSGSLSPGSSGISGSSPSPNNAGNTAGQTYGGPGSNAELPGPASGQVLQPGAQGAPAQGSTGQGSAGAPAQSVPGQGSPGQVAPAAGQAASYPAHMVPFQLSMLPGPKSPVGGASAPSLSLPVMQAIPLIPMAAVSPDTSQALGGNAPNGNQLPLGGVAPSTPENPQGNSPQHGSSPQPVQPVGGPQPSNAPDASKVPQANQPQSPSQPQNPPQGPDKQTPPESQKPSGGGVAPPVNPSGGESNPNLPPSGGTGGGGESSPGGTGGGGESPPGGTGEGGESPPGNQQKGGGSSGPNTANPCTPVPTTKPTEKPKPTPKPTPKPKCPPTTEAPKKPKPPKKSPPVLPPVGPMPHFPRPPFPFPHPHFPRPHFPHPHFPVPIFPSPHFPGPFYPHHHLHFFNPEVPGHDVSTAAPVEQPILIGQCQDYDPECPAFKMAGKCEESRSIHSQINIQELCALTCGLCNRFVKIGDEVNFDLRHKRPRVHQPRARHPKVTDIFPEYNKKFLRSIISHHRSTKYNNRNNEIAPEN